MRIRNKCIDDSESQPMTSTRLASTPSTGMKLVSVDQVVTPMRDGVSLLADLYRPPSGRVPTLLLRTPYSRRNLPDLLREVEIEPLLAVREGYAVMLQDLRGRFDSEGEFAPFLPVSGCDCRSLPVAIRRSIPTPTPDTTSRRDRRRASRPRGRR
jgi:predicted acyl esterase